MAYLLKMTEKEGFTSEGLTNSNELKARKGYSTE
jgi:hypothetical protein